MAYVMLYATDVNTDGNKLDSINDGFWFKSVPEDVINLMFEALSTKR